MHLLVFVISAPLVLLALGVVPHQHVFVHAGLLLRLFVLAALIFLLEVLRVVVKELALRDLLLGLQCLVSRVTMIPSKVA